MTILKFLLNIAIWPGNRFCESVGASPQDDSGMLRGFVNSIVWGAVAAITMINLL